MGGRAHLNETPPSSAGHLGFFSGSQRSGFSGWKKNHVLGRMGVFWVGKIFRIIPEKPWTYCPFTKSGDCVFSPCNSLKMSEDCSKQLTFQVEQGKGSAKKNTIHRRRMDSTQASNTSSPRGGGVWICVLPPLGVRKWTNLLPKKGPFLKVKWIIFQPSTFSGYLSFQLVGLAWCIILFPKKD